MNCIAYGRQLPVEVLEVVFQRCLPQDDYIRPNRSQAPLLLCQICSSWRRVALVTPRLWCSLSIELSRRPGAWKAFLDSWLGRSGKTPISLSFTRHQNTYYGYFNDHILKILLRDSKRWRSLRLDVPATTLTKLLNTSMPLLETFEIKSPGTFPGVFITAADAPNLRSVSVLDAETRAADMHVPWDRLTQFHASKHIVDLEKCFVLLARCKNLARCSIRLSTGGGQLPQHLLPLRMPRLHTLLLLADEDAVNSFFTKVELPRLESLALMHVRDETFELGAQSPLVLLTNLRSLCLGGGATEGLLEMVIAIPSLKDVYLGKETGKYKVLPKAVQKIVDMRRSAKETPREVLF
ncbi:hypothetical protein C8R43DRAFT_982239 [Mycena crocata]|nr:hypothetical protein C8R43DRAFT_982239 [Mycena crocata]